ncbi:energy transducer TonB [Caulobacter sp. NIBR1757]|uniref:energy transducer TonB n=1 Tax=Caulobacter sp. NIBR1757 TaxID=3016000 RepID=UPI0022EFF442|nr:energy transducer TonB [Caulobacter sp. NIBR1757]WGM37192.1 hypothetical protein AMEJIAPC_00086 [Caulobacter sp. NIBR1757]
MKILAFTLLMMGAPPTEVSGVVITPPPVVEEADLTAKPSGQDVESAFPPSLRGQTISVDVKMRCLVDAAGKPKRCDLLAESPYGLGLGKIGTDLMERKGRFKPRRIDGKPVDGGQVEFTLVMSEMGRPERLITNPVWAAAPSLEEMTAAWPADRQGDEAVVVLRCTMRRSGELEQCRAVNDADKVLVGAARTLSERFRVRLTPEDARRAVRADVFVSLRFFNPAGASGQERRVRAPEWIVTPEEKVVQAVYPDRAVEAGIFSGRGVADCLVAPDGTLADCRVAAERPDDAGFGEAAAQVAGQLRLNLWSQDGRPTAALRIRLPIDFNQAPDEAAK